MASRRSGSDACDLISRIANTLNTASVGSPEVDRCPQTTPREPAVTGDGFGHSKREEPAGV